MAKKKTEKPTYKHKNDFLNSLMELEGVYQKTLDDCDFVPVGDISIDMKLGGGIAIGSTTVFQGPPSSGKTLTALALSKSFIEKFPDRSVLWIASEHKVSQKALRRFGLVGDERFNVIGLNNLETALDVMDRSCNSEFFSLIVVDSLDGMATDEQDERDIHDGSKVGGYKAKILSEWLGKLSSSAYYTDTTILFIRQVRANPGAMFTSSEVVSGGKALDHYATTILRFGPCAKENVEEKGALCWQGATVDIRKTNQGARPSTPITTRFYIGEDLNIPWGFDLTFNLVSEALSTGVVIRGGAMYSASPQLLEALGLDPAGELKWRGKNNLIDSINEEPELKDALINLIKASQEEPHEYIDADDEEDEDLEEPSDFSLEE